MKITTPQTSPRFGQVYEIKTKAQKRRMSIEDQESALRRNIQGHIRFSLWPWHRQANPSVAAHPPGEVPFVTLTLPGRQHQAKLYLVVGKAADRLVAFLAAQQDALKSSRALSHDEVVQYSKQWLKANAPAGKLSVRFRDYGQQLTNDHVTLLNMLRNSPIHFPNTGWAIESIEKPQNLSILKNMTD